MPPPCLPHPSLIPTTHVDGRFVTGWAGVHGSGHRQAWRVPHATCGWGRGGVGGTGGAVVWPRLRTGERRTGAEQATPTVALLARCWAWRPELSRLNWSRVHCRMNKQAGGLHVGVAANRAKPATLDSNILLSPNRELGVVMRQNQSPSRGFTSRSSHDDVVIVVGPPSPPPRPWRICPPSCSSVLHFCSAGSCPGPFAAPWIHDRPRSAGGPP